MKINNLCGYRNLGTFVGAKLQRLNQMPKTFDSLFTMLFAEKDNVLYERSEGYKIVKTTYGEAYDGALKRANALKEKLAAAPADAVVGIHMDNGEAWIECFWAILKAGFQPLLLNMRLDDDTLAEALKTAKAVAVISDGRAFSLPTFRPEDLQSDIPCAGECGTALYVMSSGTSGKAKLCCYQANAIFAQLASSSRVIQTDKMMRAHCDGELKLLTFLPFYHIFGLCAVYMWFSFFSRTFVHLSDLAPQTIRNTIRRHRVTHIFAVPLFWESVYNQAMITVRGRGDEAVAKMKKAFALCKKWEKTPALYNMFTKKAFAEVRENLFGDSIRFLITGGSGIKPNVLRFYNDIGYRMVNGYGMTEVCVASVELSTKPALRNQGFIGKPLPYVEYKIDENGQLLVRGDSMASSIIEGDKISYNQGDWFATGDLASEEKGRYRILGRMDDVIILPNGENLNPAIVENRLHIGHDVCLVAGAGKVPVPTLIVSVGRARNAEYLQKLQNNIKEQLLEIKCETMVNRVVFTDQPFIQGNEFKTNRKRLKRELDDGTLSVLTLEQAQSLEREIGNQTEKEMIAIFASVLDKKIEEISPTGDFFMDYGGTSLEYFALMEKVQEQFSVPMSTENGMSLSTVQSLAAYIGAYDERMDLAD